MASAAVKSKQLDVLPAPEHVQPPSLQTYGGCHVQPALDAQCLSTLTVSLSTPTHGE